MQEKLKQIGKLIVDLFKEFWGKTWAKKACIFLVAYTIVIVFITVQVDRIVIANSFKSAMQESLSGLSGVESDSNGKHGLFEAKPTGIKIGEKITTNDISEITITKFKFAKTINPPRPGMFYNTYSTKDSNTVFLDLITTIKNLETDEKDASNFITASAKYDNKYDYDAFQAVEATDGSDFDNYGATIDPLQSRKIHLLIELPKTAQNDNKSLSAYINIGDKTYELKIK